jgi:RHS repeat-associated protein
MPERYVSDTSSKCMTLTQSRWVTTWVDSCYNISTLLTLQNNTGGAIAVGTPGNGMEIDASRVNSSVSFDMEAEPAVEQLFTFEIASLTAGTGSMIAVEESIGGQWKTLNSVPLDKIGLITLSFIPLSNEVRTSVIGPVKVELNKICRKKPVQYQESYLTEVCNGDKDRYRFGFNGQEKVNEIAGVGNHLDFTFRGYDSRVGRFNSVDPLAADYPWNSTYAFAENRVIDGIDLEGAEWYRAVKKWLYGNTIIGLIDNTSTTIKAAASGDKRAQLSLVSTVAPTIVEGKNVMKNGTSVQKEEFVTTLVLDLGTIWALSKVPQLKNSSTAIDTKIKPKIQATIKSAEIVNKTFAEKGWSAPYKVNTSVAEFKIPQNIKNLVRLSGKNNVKGDWYTTSDQISGLTPSQLKDKFSLKYEPTHITPIEIERNATIRVGQAEEVKAFQTNGGGFQIERIDGNVKYGETKPIN